MNRKELSDQAVDFLDGEQPEAGPLDEFGSFGPTGDRFSRRKREVWRMAGRYSPVVGGWSAILVAALVAAGGLFDLPASGGSVYGDTGVSLPAALLLATLGVSMLLIKGAAPDPGAPAWRGRLWAGLLLAGVTATAALALLAMRVTGPTGDFWQSSDFWRVPSDAILIGTLLIGLGLATIEVDRPRYRLSDWLIALTGIGMLFELHTRGYQLGGLIGASTPFEPGLLAVLAMLALFGGLIFIRPKRDLAAFLVAPGAESDVVRLVAPAALLLATLLGITEFITELAAGGAGNAAGTVAEIGLVAGTVFLFGWLSHLLLHFYRVSVGIAGDDADRAEIFEDLCDGVALVGTADQKIIFSNSRFEEIFGYERSELRGARLQTLIPADEHAGEARLRNESARRLVADGSTLDELRLEGKDGRDVWCRTIARLSSSTRYGPVAIVSMTDVTEEHRIRKANRELDSLFRRIFAESPVGICLVGSDHSFSQVNPAFERLVGYSEGELKDLTYDQLIHPADRDRELNLSDRMFRGDSSGFEVEKRFTRKDGQTVWVDITSTLLAGEDGEPARALKLVEDVTARHELQSRLEYMADHDPLTGLFNRRRFDRELSHAVDRSANERGLAVLLLDLDDFKSVNDRYGHATGDRLIVRTAEVLTERLRGSDALARQGGDEFVIVLREIGREGAVRVARKILEAIERDVRIESDEVSVRVTASIGVAYAEPGAGATEEELTSQADIAMYEAKDDGRNCVRVYDPAAETGTGRGVDWSARIEAALDADDFVVYAQPMVGLGEYDVPLFELLIRMKDDDGELVPPGAFLPVAERHDLIQGIDRWMAVRAIRLIAGQGDPACEAPVSINLSDKSIGDPGLLAVISEEIAETGIDPSRLIFEVAETSAIRNVFEAQSFAADLKRLGCRLALDDFGTSFASFYYLREIDCEYVKIDGEFVRGMVSDPVDRQLVKAMIEIAKGMGKLTIAEQVEDEAALEILADFGVDYVQGRLIEPPAPVEEFDMASHLGALTSSTAGG
jgi:diguanylate cyclase (GGDEF)-like protein/PAS domain S-box-containing protein